VPADPAESAAVTAVIYLPLVSHRQLLVLLLLLLLLCQLELWLDALVQERVE
jgi:hypothetical protein